jgi:6-pyruvoyltetrahydropterin/6-carboxytetrahydropterin synthase
MKFEATKTFEGFSTAFRQWRAAGSHCSVLHGYALEFEATFSGDLDVHNWVIDFGGFKDFRELLKGQFDHTTIVADDDPHFELLCELDSAGVIDMRVMRNVGCERFAELVMNYLAAFIKSRGLAVTVESVTCHENFNNSATARMSDEEIQGQRNLPQSAR